jgi:cell division protein FtsX
MTIVRGRAFTADDLAGKTKVAVINERMARHFFGERDPLGHHIGYGDPTDVEIVGIVRDVRQDGPRDAAPVMAYFPLAQNPQEFARSLFIRVSGPVEPARTALRAAVSAVNPRLLVREVVTLSELTSRIVTNDRLVSRLTGIFGILAVGVACLGLYGTIAFSVVRRTNEIGVRIALGATRGGVGWMILRETLAIVVIGCALGLAGLLPLFNYVKSLLFGLSPHDPSTLASAVAVLVAIGLVAGAIPAWRASRVDPLSALRTE